MNNDKEVKKINLTYIVDCATGIAYLLPCDEATKSFLDEAKFEGKVYNYLLNNYKQNDSGLWEFVRPPKYTIKEEITYYFPARFILAILFEKWGELILNKKGIFFIESFDKDNLFLMEMLKAKNIEIENLLIPNLYDLKRLSEIMEDISTFNRFKTNFNEELRVISISSNEEPKPNLRVLDKKDSIDEQ